MRKGGGKAKGAGFERDVCKALSLWITAGAKEDCFWRSAMSGGRATVGRKKGKELTRQAGDITATSPEGHALTDYWYVECKFVKELRYHLALITGEGALAQYWREAVTQATAHKKMPMLIAKQNGQKTIVLVPTAHLINPYGSAMYPAAHLGRFSILRADVLDWEGMLKLPYQPRKETSGPFVTDYPFLKPGELERILFPGRRPKPPKIKRERLDIPKTSWLRKGTRLSNAVKRERL